MAVKKFISIIFILLLGFFSILMIDITLSYSSLDTSTGFLRIKQWVFRSYSETFTSIWITAFFIHVFTSMFAIIAGFTQFFRGFTYKKIHRIMGYSYIISVLLFSATSGFIMSLVANGGISSVIAFTLLSVLWWTFTYLAFTSAKNQNFEQHRKWMIRSYALAVSAITLRLWKWMYANWIDPDMELLHPMDLYRIVAWAGWVPNLLFAEFIIRKERLLKLSKPSR